MSAPLGYRGAASTTLKPQWRGDVYDDVRGGWYGRDNNHSHQSEQTTFGFGVIEE